jgi:LmbE family N-acetylglucosaminyl deacetylase
VVCLAPHPDDEVIGCGGLLSLVAHHKIDLLTIVITGGQAQVQSGWDREQESREAASVLGVTAPEFWGYQDRALSATPELVGRIEALLRDRKPTHLLAPALSEPHPDHQGLALAACRAAVQSGLEDLTLVFYEVGAPMVPNMRVDISAVAERKWQAVRCFASQQAVHPYLQIAQAMARLRAHGLSNEVVAAEAFYCVSVRELREKGHGIAVPTVAATRQRLSLAQGAEDLPLVSVLVRSTGRTSLFETLKSIAEQHYPNVECVLVCAHGRAHPPHQFPEGLLVREVFAPDQAPLGRAQAANQALSAAQGEYCLYLDDDDLIDPDHLSRLVSSLGSQGAAPAAYAGVRVETADGQLIRDYDLPWSVERLQALNFLPIHAVLFRRSVVLELGLQFREDLPVLEDWDFWRRLAQAGAFIHVAGVSARYRKLDLGSGVSQDGENDWKVWQQKLLVEWTAHASPDEQARLLAWHARALDAQEQSAYALHQSLDAIQRERLELLTRLERHESLRRGFEQQIQDALTDRDRVSRAYEAQIRDLGAEISRLHQAYGQQLQAALESRELLRVGFMDQLQVLKDQRDQVVQSMQDQLQVLKDQRDQVVQSMQDQVRDLTEMRDGLSLSYQRQLSELELDRERLRTGFEEQIRALLADRDASIQKYEQTLSALRFDRDALHQKLGRIVNSRLWRLTAPLREILRWLTHRR